MKSLRVLVPFLAATIVLLQNSAIASAFVDSASLRQHAAANRLSTATNKGQPPSMTPGKPSQPLLTKQPSQPLTTSSKPSLIVRKYANDHTADFGDGAASSSSSPAVLEHRRKEWVTRSVNYYAKVMREERRRLLGQAPAPHEAPVEYQESFNVLAKKHYFALRKIKDGKPQHAERIYRHIIGELQQDVDCDNAKLAVTTLLLALLLQRGGSPPQQTRSVFLNFFRVAMLEHGESTTKDVFSSEGSEQCACSAKVMQAYALFEMKQGNSLKSLQLVQKAIQLDPSLEPVLNWKQFRDAKENYSRYLSAA